MAGASAPLRRLGAELRRLREATGRTQGDVGGAIGRTHASLVNWEHGKTRISKSDLACLLAELGAPRQVRAGLEELRVVGQGTGRWAVYRLADWLRPLVSFEQDAVEVWAFEPVVMPGLVQTEEYARAIHAASPALVTSANLDRWVAARMERQRRLSDHPPLRLHVVISEAVLRNRVGGPSVMIGQLRHLLTMPPNVTVRVLPFDVGAYPGMAGNFAVLRFADPAIDPPLGYLDGPLGGSMIDDAGDVAALAEMFAEIGRVALPEGGSRSLIRAARDDYVRETGDD